VRSAFRECATAAASRHHVVGRTRHLAPTIRG
jgi:hypothetical protein